MRYDEIGIGSESALRTRRRSLCNLKGHQARGGITAACNNDILSVNCCGNQLGEFCFGFVDINLPHAAIVTP